MGSTWRDHVVGDPDDTPTVAAWNRRRLGRTVAEEPGVMADRSGEVGSARSGEELLRPVARAGSEVAVVGTLLHIAAAGVDDVTAGVFLRCWADGRGVPSVTSRAALAIAAQRVVDTADISALATVTRWIDALAPARTAPSPGVRRFLRTRPI